MLFPFKVSLEKTGVLPSLGFATCQQQEFINSSLLNFLGVKTADYSAQVPNTLLTVNLSASFFVS